MFVKFSLGKLIMPDKCMVCGDVTLLGAPVCAECMEKFCALFDESCPACKKERKECSCGKGGGFLFYYYTPVSKAVIAAVKHRLDRETADFIAELIYRSIKDDKKYDCVVYPPRTRRNIIKYGFDQAKEISSAIAAKLGVRAVSAIARNKQAQEQKLLSASQRIKNARGMFAADKEKLTGCRRVLLFDDVFTTGATVKACESALRAAGVREVRVFTIAFTPKSKRGRFVKTLTRSGGVYKFKKK